MEPFTTSERPQGMFSRRDAPKCPPETNPVVSVTRGERESLNENGAARLRVSHGPPPFTPVKIPSFGATVLSLCPVVPQTQDLSEKFVPNALDAVLDLLDLEPIEVNLFRGRSPQEDRQRVFGGQVLSQALVAAGRTVEDRIAHSFHAYFLRPGDPTVPILYEVDRIRDGRSFTTRRVVAVQHGKAIFNMAASFQVHETGLEHQIPMPDGPSPDDLPTQAEHVAELKKSAPPDAEMWFDRERAFEERYTDPINWFKPTKQEPHQRIWLKTTSPLADDLSLHQAILAYASDMSLLDTSVMPHGVSFFDSEMQIASLDHAMWFHRPFRADEWLLYVTDSPSSSNARGFNRGSIYAQSGELVASVVQEGLMRCHPPKKT